MTRHDNKSDSCKRRRSSEIVEYDRSPKQRKLSDSSSSILSIDRPFSPAALARKLDELQENIFNENVDQLSAVELRGLDRKVLETEEEYMKRREEVRRQLSNPEAFDANGKTELNYDDAAVAGAKLLIDETRATRSICKKLLEECGINEDEILYKPLPYNEGTEYQSAKHLLDSRQASVVESFVDFKKQIKFKYQVLDCVALKNGDRGSKSDGRLTRRAKQKANVLRTPCKYREFNPLDEKKIIEKYALEVASEVHDSSRKRRRRIAPVPFDITSLDDIDF